ncbi:MAG: hypothetical protein KAS12_07330 [Candidatus Aenigmarchaeota archaeon]|nr:hypothetical protein [Candidatus Aenigmarchaeota archaeon]
MAQKHRISLTLDEEIVKRIDDITDGVEMKNRSDAIEKILKTHFKNQKLKQAIILCGGRGIKNQPATLELPESMMPYKNKPILEHIITHLKNEGLEEIILAVGYKHEKITSYFGNGQKLGIAMNYIIENEPKGTAGAILEAKDMINETFIILNGDVIAKINILDMLKMHRQTKTQATMALTTTENPQNYGVAQLRGNKIIGFVEKPEKNKAMTKLINAGVYIAEPSIFELIADMKNKDKNKKLMLEDMFNIISKQELLTGYVYDGAWFDVNTKENMGLNN